MPMQKTNKSVLKRMKITKTGKLIRRKARVNHFNAKESGRTQRRHDAGVMLSGTSEKLFKSYLPHSHL